MALYALSRIVVSSPLQQTSHHVPACLLRFHCSFLRLYLLWQMRTSSAHKTVADYCLKCLERVLHKGSRAAPPSYVEVEAILLRNPGEYSHPMSVPVYLSNNNHFLAGLDASCTFDEMTASVRATHSEGCWEGLGLRVRD